jgi:hypothetical protein
MKTFNNCAAQGDLLIRRIGEIPKDAEPVVPENGKYILAHSETGHHHCVAEKSGVEYFTTEDPMVAYLRVIDSVEVTLDHERGFDTHESLLIKGGTYEIRRQREYTPEGWRRVAD